MNTRNSLLIRLKPDSPSRELAWEEFHLRYAPIITAFGRKLGVRSAEEIEELVQDVMVGFYAQSAKFEYNPQKGSFRGFLKVCTFRTLCKKRGRDAKFQGVPVESIDVEAPEIDSLWQDVWARERMRQALESLHRRYSKNEERLKTFKAFEQYVLNQVPASKVAEDLDMKVNSVHQAKTRLTAELQLLLHELQESEG